MIPGSSVVILDDDPTHLKKLTECLNLMGYAALPVLFTKGAPQIEEPLSSAQILFLDIHLVPAAPLGPAVFDTVALALEHVIGPDNGPYVLVTWSSNTAQHEELMRHLSTNMNPEVPAPAASAMLDKNVYLAEGSDLPKGVEEAVSKVPQVTALLEWSNAGRIAAGEVINSLLQLLPRDDRFLGNGGAALDRHLTAIAREGAGGNASADITAAMNEGFGPILVDRLLHSTAKQQERMEKVWGAAIGNVEEDPRLEPPEKAALNTMASISLHDIENVLAGSRGAVCELPDWLADDAGFRSRFAYCKDEIVEHFVCILPEKKRARGKLSKAEKAELRSELCKNLVFRLVGLSAACDHAWGKVPIKKLLLGVEISQSFLENFCEASHGAIYTTPLFRIPGRDEPGKLILNWRYYVAAPSGFEECKVHYRLREPLLSHLLTQYHVYGFRPGIPDY
jgi:hypothetical protein